MNIQSTAGRAARRLLGAGLLSLLSGLACAASGDGLWHEVEEVAIARGTAQRQIVPQEYRTVRLDRSQFSRLVATIPMERDVALRDSSARLTLPLPDGSYGSFRVVESPVMAPGLAARYPQLRTWVGQGIDDPSATLRFDLTHKGFHAQIISADGTSYVDPFQPGDLDNYIAYRKHALLRDQPFICGVTDEALEDDDVLHLGDPKAATPEVSSGATLRTYRLAMAATGEYTQALGGTVADGLAGIVTTMNRVNGIYERDLSVRMELVENTDVAIFTNGATDPFTNNNGSAMLDQNLETLEDLIGTENFDIGHVVSTGGGGVAQLASVCGSGRARGVTGLPNPTTDAYDVDFVAHEMGHQFNGSHTFNGSGGNCSGGNRSGPNAYEPGSGVTIQAYAGICGEDDLQPHSEDYFHRRSLDTMLSFTTNPGTGGSCGVATPTGNAIPEITTDPSHVIPALTPFELSASATDADDAPSALTYIWEQFDLGDRNPAGALSDNGGPLFRSYRPERSGTRIFPSLRYILDEGNAAPPTAPLEGTTGPSFFTAELLPSTNRTMNFRATVRDNRGGTNDAAKAITVVAAAGPFRVTAPDTDATTWTAGASETVTWDIANTDQAPVNAANVRILLSLDGGYEWPIELAASVPNNGSASVIVPADTPATTRARVRVQAVGNIFFDVSNDDFTITGGNTPPTISGITLPVLTTRQGSPTAVANIATVSDATDAPGDIAVQVSGAPAELDVSVVNNAGTVQFSATAGCTLVATGSGDKSYPMRLQAIDTDGASSSAQIVVRVGANQTPTLGNYTSLTIDRDDEATVPPSAGPGDANGNFDGMQVTPSTLPGGGTLSVDAAGVVTVSTGPTTQYGTYPVEVAAIDTCGATELRRFTLRVAPPLPLLEITGTLVPGGNRRIDQNECNDLEVTLTNFGSVTATGVSATLSTTSPGVSIWTPVAAFPDIPPGESRTSLTPFEVGTSGDAVCFSDAEFDLSLSYGGGGTPPTLAFELPIGQQESENYEFFASTGATIPAGGTFVAGSSGDDSLVNLTSPFAFVLYETVIPAGTTLRASTNGTLQVGGSPAGSREYLNGRLPASGTLSYPNDAFPANSPVLFPYWNDLTMTQTGGGIYQQVIGTAPNRQWVIEWRAQQWASSPNTINTVFAVVFNEGVEGFEFVYAQTGGPEANGVSSTIGVQAATTGTKYTLFSRNTASVAPGTRLTAVRPLTQCLSGSGACGTSIDIFANGFESP